MDRQFADGTDIIQAGRDVIFQIVSGINAVEDMDGAIHKLHGHLDGLQKRKGNIDARIIMAIFAGAASLAGYYLWNWWTPPLFIAAIAFIYIGGKLRTVIARIDVELTAGNLVLVELYKQKILTKITATENC